MQEYGLYWPPYGHQVHAYDEEGELSFAVDKTQVLWLFEPNHDIVVCLGGMDVLGRLILKPTQQIQRIPYVQ